MLNPIAVHNHFNNLPAGFDQSCLRQHVTLCVALAVGSQVLLPPADVPEQNLQPYFFDNIEQFQACMYDINEIIPFEVDRAQQLAFKIYRRRYEIAYCCQPMDLLHGDKMFGDVFRSLVPEMDNLCLDSSKIADTVEMFKSHIEKKEAA